jgi:nicotinate-nucleotide adenylyltransferase
MADRSAAIDLSAGIDEGSSMRVGVFGGSFDPIHLGHLILAECCRDQCGLDCVRFVPATVSPHKRDLPSAPASARLEMLHLAIDGHRAFEVSTVEIDRGGISYTVDTLEGMKTTAPDDELFLLLGADSLVDLPLWRRAERICQLAVIVAVARPGCPAPSLQMLRANTSPQARMQAVTMPNIGISSSQLRRQIRAGASVRYQIPRAVEKYITANGLYLAGN